MINISKRNILKTAMFGSGVASICSLTACARMDRTSTHLNEQEFTQHVKQIKQNIQKPAIPNRDFYVEDFGAVADGKTNCTQAFAEAIKQASQAGGGRVIASQGIYLTGAIHLESYLELHIARGATLSFIPDPSLYLPLVRTRYEGMELMGYSPLIYAFNKTDIAITGEGIVEGNANQDNWWAWSGKFNNRPNSQTQRASVPALVKMIEANVPVENRILEQNYLRPPFIQPYLCKNILIEGITVKNSPFWCITPVFCRSVTVNKVHCVSLGPNSDGCNPDSCSNVLIQNCIFDTGDDCIAIKSGKNTDGRRVDIPCQNIVIEDCQMKAGHGGVVIGSEVTGSVRNIFALRCFMDSPELDRAIRIKTNSVRGGIVENCHFKDIKVGQVKDAIVINYFYGEGDAGQYQPIVRNLTITNFYCEKAQRAFVINGYPTSPVSNIKLDNVQFAKVEKESVIQHIDQLDKHNVIINGQSF
ncbi:glycoside hydrolase family 28 protein [Catenovulum sp. 2E275]|uniref:glycoside hydrolase family 28 protein n=1 Tax=Catenovulum sp. 2E275 TaxID=2980497 RepID=UPI0021D251F6|nr:glycoside hydrolase family 28 protein [Catenovulum sp. 2E275]MCU4675311.1 glycoside hydrolase family 28 protein [Catenovulum sp. 2E275]